MEFSITNATVAPIPQSLPPLDCAASLEHFLPHELIASEAGAVVTRFHAAAIRFYLPL
jgi:hypothetical protein